MQITAEGRQATGSHNTEAESSGVQHTIQEQQRNNLSFASIDNPQYHQRTEGADQRA
jgi:hypothetical protein